MLRKLIASAAVAGVLLVSVSFAEDAVNGAKSRFGLVDYANAATSTGSQTLTATVLQTITLTLGTSTVPLGSLTPGAPVFATTSLTIASNSSAGVTLAVNRNSVTSTLVHSDTTTTFPDATAWNGSNSTTTNLVGANLHFKVAQTGTDAGLYSSTFWGPNDTDGASNAKYAGFPSASQTIASNASYVASNQTIVSRYRMDAPATQKSGSYSGGITYTATTNP